MKEVRADYVGLLVLFLPDGYAMLMRPNKAETAVHGCHCPGDMAVRMRNWPDRGLAISFPEPTCLLVSTKTRVLVLTKWHVGSGN